MNTRVLIIDDESEFLMLLADYLTEKGMTTDFAATLRDAREILLSRHYDVLVTDVMVSQRGVEATLEFIEFAKEQCPWIKIIAMTGVDHFDVKFALRQYGVDGIIFKPFALYEMAQLVASVSRDPVDHFTPGRNTTQPPNAEPFGPDRIAALAEKVLAQYQVA